MTSAVDVVVARLGQISALTALVGSRIYAMKLPQSPTLPAVRVTLVSQNDPAHLRGTVRRVRARVQVDAVSGERVTADPLSQARAVDAAAHGAFSGGAATGLSGWAGEVFSPAVTVSGILPIDAREGYFADDLRQVVASRDYEVWFDVM